MHASAHTSPGTLGPDSCSLLMARLEPSLRGGAAELAELSFSSLQVRLHPLAWLDDPGLQDLRELEGQQLAVRQSLEGGLNGEVVWLLKESDARRLIRLVTGTSPGPEPLGYTEREGLTEAGNLLLMGLVDGLAEALRLPLAVGAPSLRLGSAARLLPDEGGSGISLLLELSAGGTSLPGHLVLILGSLSAVYFDRHLKLLSERVEPAFSGGVHGR